MNNIFWNQFDFIAADNILFKVYRGIYEFSIYIEKIITNNYANCIKSTYAF